MPLMHDLTEALTDTHRAVSDEHTEHVASALAERRASKPDAAQALTGAPPLDLSLGAPDAAR